jgi:hypothetical protein
MITKLENQKRRVRKEIYTKIYEQFCRKIQGAVTSQQRQVVLQVPPWVLGFPSYNMESAGAYLKRQLEHSGFDVAMLSPTSLFVSWYPKTQSVKEPPPRFLAPIPEEDPSLPSLVNLRKAANKYRPR